MPVIIDLPKKTVRMSNCRIMRAQLGYRDAVPNYNFGKAVRNTTWGNSEFSYQMDARKRSGSGVKLNVSEAEFKRWIKQMITWEAQWKKAVDGNDFKKLVRLGNKLDAGLTQYLNWMPAAVLVTDPSNIDPDALNEGDKP